eukprot:9664804-Alexandrium_andersonii.AAC.1
MPSERLMSQPSPTSSSTTSHSKGSSCLMRSPLWPRWPSPAQPRGGEQARRSPHHTRPGSR